MGKKRQKVGIPCFPAQPHLVLYRTNSSECAEEQKKKRKRGRENKCDQVPK